MTPLPSPFVLIPGAGGDAWYWSRVAPLLEAAGHEAIAVDLPAADESAGLTEYADMIVDAIGDRRDVTLVAQSMGAFSAPLAVGRADVARLLLVAPMIPKPGESPSAWFSDSGSSEAYRANEAAEGRDPDAPFDERVAFFHDVDPAITDEAYARPHPDEAGKSFEEPFPLDAWPDLPTRVLLGRADRLFPYTFLVAMCRERLGIEPDAVDAGHLASLARPRAVADWLLGAASAA
ncbi:MAG TPA: alpha/beta fold hydrolase [Baekduia sp.]|nr:alpha/beta fold hydrolase [Baekduia sp.]